MTLRTLVALLATVGVCLGTCHAQTVDPGRTTPSRNSARVLPVQVTSRSAQRPPAVAQRQPAPAVSPPVYLNAPPGLPIAAGVGCQACPAWDCWIVSSRECTDKDARCGNTCLQFAYFHSERQAVRLDQQSFIQALDPTRPVCIYVHGGYYKFGDVIHEAKQIQNWINMGGPQPAPQLICFTWPSDTKIPVPPVDVIVLGHQSAVHGVFLADFVNRLPPQQAVALLGHSFGARCTASALHVLAGGVIQEGHVAEYGPIVPRRLRAVMLAPAIDHHWLNPGQRYGLATVGAEKILVMKNKLDLLLSIYPLRRPFSQPALGYGGLYNCDRRQLQCLACKIDEYDVGKQAGFRHNTDGFYDSPELSRVMAPYLSFAPLPSPSP